MHTVKSVMVANDSTILSPEREMEEAKNLIKRAMSLFKTKETKENITLGEENLPSTRFLGVWLGEKEDKSNVYNGKINAC